MPSHCQKASASSGCLPSLWGFLRNSTASHRLSGHTVDPPTCTSKPTFVTAIRGKGNVAVNGGVLGHKVPPSETEAQTWSHVSRLCAVLQSSSLPHPVPCPLLSIPAWATSLGKIEEGIKTTKHRQVTSYWNPHKSLLGPLKTYFQW